MSFLRLLDTFFLLFHSLWILLVVLGWIWSRTRRLSLGALALTAVSWFGLGYWRGWGYCVCTDWHWQVRRSLGDLNLPHNYIGFLIKEGTGMEIPDPVLEPVILGAFLTSAAGGIGLSLRDRSRNAATEDGDKKVAAPSGDKKVAAPSGDKKVAAPVRRQESRRSCPATRKSRLVRRRESHRSRGPHRRAGGPP